MRHRLILVAVTALAGLSACGEKAAPTTPERRSAAGEVLGGEITDEMLPLDTVRSTSPAGLNATDDDAAEGTAAGSDSRARSGPTSADSSVDGDDAGEPAPSPSAAEADASPEPE